MNPHSRAEELDSDQLRWLSEQFVVVFGEAVASVDPLKGDASDRRLLRLHGSKASAIGVLGPVAEENRAFVGFARSFRAAGLQVPEIYSVNEVLHCYLEEDLGDVTLAHWLDAHREDDAPDAEALELYRRVLSELVRFQIDAAEAVDYGLCYQTTHFDAAAMRFDLDYFRDMFLRPLMREPWDETALQREGDALIAMLLDTECDYFLYRDFQSRNIMLRAGQPWFIDFQSGRRGALQYDVAALLFDSKGRLTQEVRDRLLEHYLSEVRRRVDIDEEKFRLLFDGYAVLRLLQALGAFGKLGLRFGRREYLTLIPSRLEHLASLVEHADIMRRQPALRDLILRIGREPDLLSIDMKET